jgi:flagellar protein FlgJ
MDSGAVYSDFGHLAALRQDAKANPNAALEEVASQFEALFLQMMLKSMRDATVEGGLFDSSQMETYQGMADQQVALRMSEQGGIGLARMMVEQMQAKGYVGSTDSAANSAGNTIDTGLPASTNNVNGITTSALPPSPLPILGTTPAKAFAIPAATTSDAKFLDVRG